MNSYEIRNPKTLIVITEAWMKANPDKRDAVEVFHDLRAERGQGGQFEVFKNQVKEVGRITDPIKIVPVDGIGDIVVDGRQRTRAAIALGYTSVPVVIEDENSGNVIALELSSNLARSENSTLENAYAFKKALQKGLSKEKVAAIAGVSVPTVYNTIILGEMPKEVHKMIDSGVLSPSAALQLKSFGKKAAKGSGLSLVYDDEAKKKIVEHINSLDAEARLKGGTKSNKVTIKQARSSKANNVENLTSKEWDRLVELDTTPEDYAVLIRVVRGQINFEQAVSLHPENLGWLHRPELPKKEKVVKPKKEKKSADGEEVVTDVNVNGAEFNLDMFQ